MNWFTMTLVWYLTLLIVGLIFFPLTRLIFGRFFYDRGYPFAKTIGILLLTFAIFVIAFLKLLPYRFDSLIVILGLWLALNAFIFARLKKNAGGIFQMWRDKKALAFILVEEVLFIVSLVAFVFVRGQEPSIHGLEKFMDYGIMQAILRSEYFPPLDMWLSGDPQSPGGYPINYYYFGQMTGSTLIQLTQVPAAAGYNLVLATIFAQGITLGFSLCSNLVYIFKRNFFETPAISKLRLIVYGLVGSFMINLAGNLHTIYAFTRGYDPDSPVPFWQILLSPAELFQEGRPSTYWYPNATRFIPKTIHEFPSYSYVVADLHGHVFDIPFVLLSLSLLLVLFLYGMTYVRKPKEEIETSKKKQGEATELEGFSGSAIYREIHRFSHDFITTLGIRINEKGFSYKVRFDTLLVVGMGFMCAVHYMTNALNGPIYLLATVTVLLIIYGFSNRYISMLILLGFSFFVFSFPFSVNFSPFTSGIGVNCAPAFLTQMEKLGPFLFEAGNCQSSALYMMFILWGFFWMGIVVYAISIWQKNKVTRAKFEFSLFNRDFVLHPIDLFTILLFTYGIFLTLVPEFFYVKDIYPDHFRANTMFKLGYQSFIMMSIAMTVVLFRIRLMRSAGKYALKAVYGVFFFFIFLYPFFAFPSYYPGLFSWDTYTRPPELYGDKWLLTQYPQDYEIIQWFNENVEGQPTILESQGDSYTDHNRVSAYTGLPTVAGWWVHQWLWRGSPDVVGRRIPDIETIYQSGDIGITLQAIEKYNVEYIVVSELEREKYTALNEEKIKQIATEVFKSKNGVGSIYKVNK